MHREKTMIIKMFEFSYPELRFGDEGKTVEIMQFLLHVRGVQLPVYGIDGEFGSETQGGVQRVQAQAGLTMTGVCDIETWSYLLTGEVKSIESNDIGEDPAPQVGV